MVLRTGASPSVSTLTFEIKTNTTGNNKMLIKISTYCATAILSFCMVNLVFAQDTTTEKQTTQTATINDVAWIAGNWQGEAMGGQFEETWNKPSGGTMMGMFKLIQKGNVAFYELCTIVEKENSLVLRIKHFNHDMSGWEEKDKCMEFPLVSANENEAKFDGLVFKKTGDDSLLITVTTKRGDRVSTLKFPAKRVK